MLVMHGRCRAYLGRIFKVAIACPSSLGEVGCSPWKAVAHDFGALLSQLMATSMPGNFRYLVEFRLQLELRHEVIQSAFVVCARRRVAPHG